MSSSFSYTRNTELRNVEAKDLYNLAVILEEDNYWQDLMEIIPKEINNQTFSNPCDDLQRVPLASTVYERKYNNDHIRLIQNAILRPGESRLFSQILFDEWGSSGRKHERPTLGVVLYLLVQSKLYRAADYVAELLNEPKPARPLTGPAAEYEFDIDVFNDIKEAVNDSRFYPDTSDLEANVNNDINKDFYTKYHELIDKKLPSIKENNAEVPTMTSMAPKAPTNIKENNAEVPTMTSMAPKPPPRSQKSAKILKQQQLNQLQQTAITSNSNSINSNCIEHQQQHQHNNEYILTSPSTTTTTSSTNGIPNLSILMNPDTSINCLMVDNNSIPKLSIFQNCSDGISQPHIKNSEQCSTSSLPSIINTKSHNVSENHLPTVLYSKSLEDQLQQPDSDNQHHDLPAISALNLNGERDDDGNDNTGDVQLSCNSENIPLVAVNFDAKTDQENSGDDFDIPHMVANIVPQTLESIAEDYNGIQNELENEHDNDVEVELDEDNDDDDDDDNSLPNLSFLDNCSSNNESSLTSVTNTSGDNSFE